MCDPVSLAVASVAVGTASSVMGFEGQSQAYKANEQAANIGYANQANVLGEQSEQIDQQQSESAVSAVVARAEAQGRISASASSTGLGNSAVEQAGNAAAFGAGRDQSIRDLNAANQRLQTQNQLTGAAIDRQSQINSKAQANPLSLVLGIAKAGLGGASTYTGLGGTFGQAGANAPVDI